MVLGRLGLNYLTRKQQRRKAESIFSLVEEITIWNLNCTECTKERGCGNILRMNLNI